MLAGKEPLVTFRRVGGKSHEMGGSRSQVNETGVVFPDKVSREKNLLEVLLVRQLELYDWARNIRGKPVGGICPSHWDM